MSFDPVTALIDLGKTAIDKIFPDAESKQKRIAKLEELAHAGDMAGLEAEVKLLTGQLEINKVEAAHPNIFVSGWRPFIGWVGGFALAYQFVLYPMMLWVAAFANIEGFEPPPVLETGALFSIVTAMLGIGAMRSHDKRHGVDTKRHKP